MPELYIPTLQTHKELEYLAQGFIMDVEEDNTPVLLIKFDASILTSIIKGCKLELVVGHPNLFQAGAILMIYDNVKNPLHIINSRLGAMHAAYQSFPNVILKLIEVRRVRIALFNEALMPVFSTVLEVKFDRIDWDSWLDGVFIEKRLVFKENILMFYPEQSDKGFIVEIINEDHSKKEMLNIISYDKSSGLATSAKPYSFSNYLTDGKHGYNQEFSLEETFIPFFIKGGNLFVSPKHSDGTEFTDFIILLEDAYILIESKFVMSQKQTKITAQLKKAVNQLKNADELIMYGELDLENKLLEQELLKRSVNLRICIFNDSINLNDKRCQSIILNYEKIDLPFFISMSYIKEMLVSIYLLSEERFLLNMKLNLMRYFREHQESDRPVIIMTSEHGNR